MPQDKPKVDLNLDALEREGAPEPFAIVLGGKRYVLVDAVDTDFRDLLASQRAASVGDMARALELVVQEKDREAFFRNKISTWKLDKLFTAYNEHHGLPSPGEQNASSSS